MIEEIVFRDDFKFLFKITADKKWYMTDASVMTKQQIYQEFLANPTVPVTSVTVPDNRTKYTIISRNILVPYFMLILERFEQLERF